MVSIDKARIAQNTVAHLPFFSTTCVMPILQALCFDGLPCNGGVGVILLTRSRKIADSGPAGKGDTGEQER
jgi:hypothetical protein